jgi:NTE family protein
VNTTPSSTHAVSSGQRALVLAGGGAAGNAWQLGLIAGLSDAGVDVTRADLIIGTSAGSTAAAQITGGTPPAELYAAILAGGPSPRAGDAGPGRGRAPEFSDTGEPVVFDRHSGIELVDAVAASTSNGFGPFPPYRIGGHRYINGGYRRNENADLAAGYGRVLVLSPFGGRSRMPPEWGMDLATQVDELRAGGSRVETVFPDGGAGDVFDASALDPSTRRPAARGGYDQGRALAGPLAEIWR